MSIARRQTHFDGGLTICSVRNKEESGNKRNTPFCFSRILKGKKEKTIFIKICCFSVDRILLVG